MDLRSCAVATFAAIALLGCATPIPPPPRTPPLSGVVDERAIRAASFSAIHAAAAKRLAIIVSDSTEKQLQYMKAGVERQEKNFLYSDLAKIMEPSYLVDRVTHALKSRFKTVELVNDLNDARSTRADVIGVVDIGTWYQLHGGADQEVFYDIEVVFLTGAVERIGSAKGVGSHRVDIWGRCGYFVGSDCFRRTMTELMRGSMDQTLERFEKSLASMVKS